MRPLAAHVLVHLTLVLTTTLTVLVTNATCLCWNLGRWRRRRNGRRATGRDRGGFRRLAAAVTRREGLACLPLRHCGSASTPPAPCTHARTHTHTHAHKPAVCILQAMRPSQSTERRAESPQRISTAAVPCWRRGGRGHSVGITRARHAFIPVRHLCLHPEPRGVACGHCDETEFARRRGPKREPSRLCARGAAPTAVGSWRASCDACGVPRPR